MALDELDEVTPELLRSSVEATQAVAETMAELEARGHHPRALVHIVVGCLARMAHQSGVSQDTVHTQLRTCFEALDSPEGRVYRSVFLAMLRGPDGTKPS